MENPWVAWYPGDYINKTRSLTMGQHGAYTLLLWEYYTNGPLVAKASRLLNVCCSRTQADEQDMLSVLEQFFELRDGFYHHARADEEIEKRLRIREQRQLFGQKGGLAKATRLQEQKLKQKATQSQSHIEPKALEGGSSLKAPPKQFSQSDFDERDWRKISAAKTKINGQARAAVGGESISDQEYYAWIAEESGVTIQRVMKLCKQNGAT